MRYRTKLVRTGFLPGLVILLTLALSSPAFAQGSIFGTVTNSDATVPANGDISFYGFLDDTDEELRIETSDGAGYDAGNWFDDFQNYGTEAPGNPYDYYFYNVVNGEGFHLSGSIPNNSFQQENVQLAVVTWPLAPGGFTATALSGSSILLEWNAVSGLAYHVYRRNATSNGSFLRMDDPSGSLSNPGTTDSFYVDPTADGSSSYDYLIIADDGSGNLSPHSAVITVNSAAPSAPTIASIDPISGSAIGGTLVTIDGSGFDLNGATVQFGAATPVAANVVSPYVLTATTPSGTVGPVDVTVTNTASGLSSNTLAGAFTYEANTPPVLAAIGPKSTSEGVQLQFNVSATDADGTTPNLTTSTLPTGANFVDSGNGIGTFDWTPDFTQAGDYPVTFYATDDSGSTDSEIVTISVNQVNQPPVLAAIGSQSVDEGALLTIGVSATDPDGDIPSLAATGLPTGASFVDSGNGAGSMSWTPDFTQAGSFDVTFSATDDSGAVDDEIVTITVNQVNLPPVLASIGAQSTTEDVNLSFTVTASDPDGQVPALSAVNLPAGASFVDSGDGSGVFDWTPGFAQAGPYDVTFIATDDSLAADTEIVTITVIEAGNQTPVLADIPDTTVQEGQNLILNISATDPDAEIPALAATGLPTGATFVDSGNGIGTFEWTPDLTQSGTYNVTFKATDLALAVDSQVVLLTVVETNQPPILATIGPQSTTEGVELIIAVSATDGDGTTPVLSVDSLPPGATFVDSLNGAGSFTWIPDFTQAGTYDVMFYAADGIAIDSELVAITVSEAGNHAPVLDSIPDTTIFEGDSLNLLVAATDIDGDSLVMTAEGLPANAVFIDNFDNTGLFAFVPSFTQSGAYTVTFIASDTGLAGLADTQIVTITVNDVGNLPPVFDPIADTVVSEGTTFVLTVSATDPDGSAPPLLSINTALDPAYYTFLDNGDGTGTFTYNPDYYAAGSDSVFFFATDFGTPQQTGAAAFRLTTLEVNQPPEWVPAGPFGVSLGDTLVFTVQATDSTSSSALPIIRLSVLNAPAHATFTDNGDGTGTFRFAPDSTQAGTYLIDFLAVDNGVPQLSATQTVEVTAVKENAPPILAPIGPQTVLEGEILLVNVSATDPDGTTPTLFAEKMPPNSNFDDNGNGTGVFTFFPNFVQSGLAQVVIKASDGIATDKEVVLIQVYEAGQQVPVFDSIPSPSITEGDTGQFVMTAYDPDEQPVSISVDPATLPDFVTYVDSGNGVAVFDMTPDFMDAGDYDLSVSAFDGDVADTVTVTVTVVEAGNRLPVLDTIPPQTGTELVPLSFGLTASDIDGTEPPLLTAISLPAGASLTDNRNGTGSFAWTPGDTQAGDYEITFLAEDFDVSGVFDTMIVPITIADTNRVPLIFTSGGRNIYEGDTLHYLVETSDPDGTIPQLTAFTDGEESLVTPNMTFFDSGNGSGVLTFIPDHTQGGTGFLQYYTKFVVIDGVDQNLTDTTGTVTITVYDRNFAPTITFIDPAPYSVTEGDSLIVRMLAEDVDDPSTPLLTANQLPPNSTFEYSNDTGYFRFYPDFTQGGTQYSVMFSASDAEGGFVEVTIDIQVLEAGNQAPTFTTTLSNPYNIGVNVRTEIMVQASDPDVESIVMAAEPIWSQINAVFTDSGNGVATYAVFPSVEDLDSSYQVSFIATDAGGLADTLTTTLVVVSFLRGDLDDNNKYTMNDLAWLVAYMYRSGPAPSTMQAADVDGDGDINIGDITFMVKFLYSFGPQPPK